MRLWKRTTAQPTWGWSASSAAGCRWRSGCGKLIGGIEKRPVDTGVLDISFYRDDLSTQGPRPVVTKGDDRLRRDGRDIILMDDVLYTGRTIRAALDALFDHGRPKSVQLLVLIDRGHRELPIQATFTGRTMPTSPREIIEVKLQEIDGEEQVLLVGSWRSYAVGIGDGCPDVAGGDRCCRWRSCRSRTSRRSCVTARLEAMPSAERSRLLRGRRVALLFYESSTRTRTSFELAAKSLGATTTLVATRAPRLKRARA